MSFSFGAPSSAPATSGLTSGFNFGANKPATPGFGLTATPQPSTGLFGTTPATSAPAFGTSTAFGAAAPTFGTATPSFGASATTAFGTASATPAFGTTATPGFGATATPGFGATATPGFGATSAAPAFGATSTTQNQALSTFGASQTPGFGAITTPGFGATSAASAFGTTTAPAFGSTAPALGQTGLGTGGLNFGAGSNTATAATGLTLGTSATGLGGLGGFGLSTTTTTTQNTGLGFFSTSTANSFGPKLGSLTGVTSALPAASATSSIGLGGLATSGIGAASTTGDGKTESPKQTKLPNEISTTLDSFKEFVKKQKSLSSEVMRISIKPLHKVSREADVTLRMALSLSGDVAKARAHSKRLRASAAVALANAESVANSTGLELEGTAPPAYVKDLISELEQQLMVFRRQMDVADKQMQASPKLLTEQELTLGIRRMHESLVALAGRLQAVHTQVEGQKEQYLNLRKYILKDPTNVFECPLPSTSLDQILRDAEGTRKKTKSSHVTDSNLGSAVLSDPRAALGNIQQLAGPTPFSYIGGTFSPYSTPDPSAPTWQPQPQPALSTSYRPFGAAPANETSGFQLQKPPGKRGKQ